MSSTFPQHIIRDVKDRLDIVQVVGRYVELKRAGRSWMGLCPFHGENAPSFNVSQERGFYHCFGCQAHGDVIRFVQEIENLSFGEAIRQLAEEAGIELPELKSLSEQERKNLSEKDRLFEATGVAMELFQKQLMLPAASVARDYLARRGVSGEMIEAFRIGYAPEGWETLSTELAKRHFSHQILEKAGLILPGKRGGYYDRFRNRVVFPIIMQNNRVVGFGARALADTEEAKYINSPESPIFSKSSCLYGYHLARTLINRRQRAVLVEGNLDVVMMHQFGFGETVATLGTALTESHLRLLKRMTPNLIIIYDGDAAGQKAMFRSLELFLRNGINARAVVLPGGHDPDSFLLAEGADAMEHLIGNARYLFDIWLEAQYAARQEGPRGVSECLHTIVPMLSQIESVERAVHMGLIAQRLGVGVSVVQQALRQYATNANWERLPATAGLRAASVAPVDRTTRAEEILLHLLVSAPEELKGLYIEQAVVDKMRTPALRAAVALVLDSLEEEGQVDTAEIIARIDEKDWKNRVANLLLNYQQDDSTPQALERSFHSCMIDLSVAAIEERIRELDKKLKQTGPLSGEERVRLVNDKIQLHRQLQEMRPQPQHR